jgi:pyroglutamyl-peptidase
MKTVLLTGFEPFGGERVNPSALVVQALGGRVIAGRRVVACVLPCVFGDAIVALRAELERSKPELVICVGQAGGRAAIGVERVAINVDDARIPDNARAQPIDRRIAVRGPVGYWSTLPIKAVVTSLRRAKLPAEVSSSAGTFVCNHVFYGLMRALEKKRGVRGGFLHVPYLPQQAARKKSRPPSMSLDDMIRAIELAVRTSLRVRRDVRAAPGATH